MSRKKILKKGIESIDEQIEKHKEKIKNYKGTNEFLIPYWRKEIKYMKRRRENRKSRL